MDPALAEAPAEHAPPLRDVLRSQGLPAPEAAGPAPGPGELVRAWEESGGLALTGAPDGPPDASAAGVLAAAREAARIAEAWGSPGVERDLPELLFGRAALRGLRRGGRVSAGRTCRLLPARGGWLAVNLSRPDDRAAVPAIVGWGGDGEESATAVARSQPWAALAAAAAALPAGELAGRAQTLGVPAAELGAAARDGLPPVAVVEAGAPSGRRGARGAFVLDLSAMWAGPLCAQLLSRAGARVVKVEDPRRPDGARRGPVAFYEALHAGHELRELDLRSPEGVRELRRLAAEADVVIESSRPRALRQLGVDAADAAAGGAVWVSVTGYGRTGAAAERVAFGDDAAVAGGLVGRDGSGAPVFCGDAIADPLTGLYAAAAALGALAAGRGALIDVPMAGVAAHVAARAESLYTDRPL
jgi:hypothetical protein